MHDRLQILADRYEKLNELLSDPDVVNNASRLKKYAKEQASLEEAYTTYKQYEMNRIEIEDIKGMLEEPLDTELGEMAKAELTALCKRQEKLEQQIRILLLPKDPHDGKDIIVEIRGAAGGEEANLFAGSLYRMYMKFADSQGWRTEILDSNMSDLGGFKEITFVIRSPDAYRKMKYESGAHRVQRVPETESGGRIHTSTSTVLVMPEAEELDLVIHDKDIRVDTFCSSGAGGQSVNTTKSAVRVTHLPTGIVATCQDGKSQNDNKDKALQVLRTRIVEARRQEEEEKYSGERRAKIGTGDRSERIRTYNFPQSRVTDHRIGLTLHRLENVLNGDLQEIIDALSLAEQAAILEQEQNQR